MASPDSPARDRVRIHYKDHESRRERELPLKILVLGDFLGHPDARPLDQRAPIRVDARNLAAVLAEHGSRVGLGCRNRLADRADAGDLAVTLRVRSYADFGPERIVAQVPALRAQAERRRALIELRRWLAICPELRAALRRAVVEPPAWLAAHDDAPEPTVDPAAPAEIDGLLVVIDGFAELDEPTRARLRTGTWALLRARAGTESTELDAVDLDLHIAAIDRRLAAQIDAILHAPEFQALESLWRSLQFLVEHVDAGENCQVLLLNCSKQDLVDDFEDAPEIAKSGLYRLVYATEYGTFGGEPHGLIIADFAFDHGPVDVNLLSNCAAVAAMAHVPFVANAAPQMFGEASFDALASYEDLRALFEAPQYQRWRRFREQEDARYVGLCLPRVLLRLPWRREQVHAFAYAERVVHGSDYLWGQPAFAFATRVADSFARYRWSPNIVGPTAGGAVEGLPRLGVGAMRRRHGLEPDLPDAFELRMPTEIQICERREFELAEEGFIGLVFLKATGQACFCSASSCQRPRSFANTAEGRAQALGARLGAQLPYVFIVCRIAHYLKVLQREEIGRHLDRAELERELNEWLRQYVADMDNPAPAIRGQRPLRQAQIRVEEVAGQAGWYRAHLLLRPHLKYMGASFTLSLVGKLEREGKG